jgi:hypothetical protein
MLFHAILVLTIKGGLQKPTTRQDVACLFKFVNITISVPVCQMQPVQLKVQG